MNIQDLNPLDIQQTIFPFYHHDKKELAYSVVHLLDGLYVIPCMKKNNYLMKHAELKTDEMKILDQKKKEEIISYYRKTIEILNFMIKTQRLRTLTQKETN